ncbi:hypothetical protein JHN49_01835 [Streptomyces sp. MBT57]|nr:hypothetical protein [Streptomyces sp. MBT57]
MEDFTAGGSRKPPQPEARKATVLGPGDDAAAAQDAAELKDFITANLAPTGVTSVTFIEPPEIVQARNQILGHEGDYLHVSDGTYDGCLCGYTAQRLAPTGAPECPVCLLLDA